MWAISSRPFPHRHNLALSAAAPDLRLKVTPLGLLPLRMESSRLLPLTSDVSHELPDVQAGFRKGRGTRDQIANIHWIIEKARELQQNIYFCFIDYAKAFDCVDHNKLWKIHLMGNRWGNSVRYFWAPKSLQMVTAAMKLKDAYSLEEKL